MNRKEALKMLPKNGCVLEVNVVNMQRLIIDNTSIINKIYDDFESRACKNCKYYNGVSYVKKPYCTKHHDSWSKGEMYEFDMGKNFSCYKWEAKAKKELS